MRYTAQFLQWCLLSWAVMATAWHPACAGQEDAMDFELATLDGKAFFKLSDFPKRPILINVWGSECPPCIKETPLLNAQSRIYTNVQFLGIATDDRIASMRFATQFQVGYPQLQSPKDPAALLRRLGDARGALPFTLVLNSEHRMCASRLGEVNLNWIDSALKKCSQ